MSSPMKRPPSIASNRNTQNNDNGNNNPQFVINENRNNICNTSFASTIHSIMSNSKVVNTATTSTTSHNKNSIMLSGLNISKMEEEISALDDSIMLNNIMQSNDSFRMGVGPIPSSPRISSSVADVGCHALIPSRPRRLWTIRDTKVPTFPPFYPIPSKHTSTIIRAQPDTPPSVIAIRISECLLARSIIADYDDEAVTATCLTVDRCLFVVHIWKVPSKGKFSNHLLHQKDDLIVECVRTKGNGFAFHRAARAILLAAQGLDSGKDKRSTIQSSPLEYPRFLSSANRQKNDSLHMSTNLLNVTHYSTSLTSVDNSKADDSVSIFLAKKKPLCEVLPPIHPLKPTEVISKVQESMDTIHALLKKDRLQPQLHGMEMLVSLTDPDSVGLDLALHASLCILGRTSTPMRSSPARRGNVSLLVSGTMGYQSSDDIGDGTIKAVSGSSSVEEIQKKWVFEVIVNRRLPTERPVEGPDMDYDYDNMNGNFSYTGCTNSLASIENPIMLGQLPSKTKTPGVAKFLHKTEPSAGTRPSDSRLPTSSSDPANAAVAPSQLVVEPVVDEDHGGKMRLLALRVLVNALCNLSKHQDIVLESILSVQCPIWVSDVMLNVLSEDIQKGCCRPVQVVHSTRLASQHEATMCCRIIRILVGHNTNVKRRLQKSISSSTSPVESSSQSSSSCLLDYLELAKNIGKSTHLILAQEAHEIYQLLTEEDRSC